MVKLALGFVSGAWVLQHFASLPSLFWLCAIIPLSFLCYFAYKYSVHAHAFLSKFLSFFSIVLFSFSLGFFWAMTCANHRLSDALPKIWERQTIQVVGVVASMPQQHERGMRFEFDVEQVLTPNAVVPSHISLSEYAGGFKKEPVAALQTSHFKAGERWRLNVRLKRPHGTFNPHGFDFEAWALERNIRATGYVRNGADNARITNFVWRPSYVVESLRESIRKRMQQVLVNKPYAGVLQALAIGDDDAIVLEDWQVFLRTGVTHLISISGLHITMLSGMMFALVYAGWRRNEALTLMLPARKAATLAAVVAALAYSLVAGFSVPTQRTLYMLIVFALALWSRRNLAMSQVLSTALLVVVILDPWAVLAAGFWLSFGAVAAIAYVLGARVRRPHWIKESMLTQWAVTLGLMPVLLVMFGQVSLISPLANAFAIPVISLIVVPITLLGALLPIDSALLFAHGVLALCMQALIWLSHWPLATWQQQAPPVWTLVTALFGVIWMLLPRGFPLRFAGVAGLLPMLLIQPNRPEVGAMRVAVLDVGQGLAVVVHTHEHDLLYDAGPKYSAQADAGNRIIVPYLRGEGVRELSGMVVSHNDLDHTGGLRSVLSHIPVKWIASSLADDTSELLNHQHVQCQGGQRWQWDNVKFEMLSPTIASYQNKNMTDNNRSCVLRVSSLNGSILLTGDIEREAEKTILENLPNKLANDVLTAPHHGSKTSSTFEFVKAVQPSAVVFSVGYLNRFNHPKRDVMARYEAINSKLYRSDDDGAVIFNFMSQSLENQTRKKSIEVIRWRHHVKRYWHE